MALVGGELLAKALMKWAKINTPFDYKAKYF